MTLLLLLTAFAAALVAVAAAQYPAAPVPYSTTLLRTHHYADELFLSVGELLSVYRDERGHTWEAFFIAPGWPFDLRDDPVDPTVVLGLRVVYDYPPDGRNYTLWYYATGLDGVETCLVQGTYTATTGAWSAAGAAVVRGIDTEVWTTSDPSGSGVATTHYLTKDLNGRLYPFRVYVRYPPGSSEIEWTLDHGTHYELLQTQWFDTTGCARDVPARGRSGRAPQAGNPWSV